MQLRLRRLAECYFGKLLGKKHGSDINHADACKGRDMLTGLIVSGEGTELITTDVNHRQLSLTVTA